MTSIRSYALVLLFALALFAPLSLAHADTLCFPDGCINDTQNVRWHVGGSSALQSMLDQINRSSDRSSFNITYDASGLPTQISCFNGMTLTAYYYQCPAGQVGTPPNCTTPSTTPSGCGPGTLNDQCTGGQSGSCTASYTVCGQDGNLHDDCGGTTSCGGLGCSVATNQCNASCQIVPFCSDDGSVVLNSCTGGVFEDCKSEGKVCSQGVCVIPPPTFTSFNATLLAGPGPQSFNATGHLQAMPALVPSGMTTHLYWDVSNAKDCSIVGGNGDSWTDLFSGASGQASSPITGQTVYTLHCNPLPGAQQSPLDDTATVNILPSFNER
jgi:hypothetical protein